MKFVKKFKTELQFNNFTLDENNTPNVSLIEELYATGGIVYTSFVQSGHDYSQDYFTIEAIDNIDIILFMKPEKLFFNVNFFLICLCSNNVL